MDGVSFIKKVKSNSILNHIPIIALSALNNIDEQIKSIGAGAEAYITKPFDIQYLETIANRLILRKDELKAYYNSVYSTFELENGHLLHAIVILILVSLFIPLSIVGTKLIRSSYFG